MASTRATTSPSSRPAAPSMARAGTGAGASSSSSSSSSWSATKEATAGMAMMAVEELGEEDLMRVEAESEDWAGTREHLRVLLRQESRGYPLFGNYLAKASQSPVAAKDRVSEAWRRKLCEWCFEVVDHFNYDREVVSFALHYLDRSAALQSETSEEPLPKREYQLLAVTSLYMAIKIHGETDERDGPRRKLRIGAFVELSRGFFAADTIEATELRILESLHWRINPPTCLRFMTSLFPLCPKWTMPSSPCEESSPPSSASPPARTHAAVLGGIYDVARYLSELSVCVSHFAFECKTSVTAYASILCAMEALQHSLPLPAQVRRAFLRNVSEATGLQPSDADVVRVCALLREICPTMFEKDDHGPYAGSSSHPQETAADHTLCGGKASPVSVLDAPSYHAPATPTSHHHLRGASASSTSPSLDDGESPRSQRKRKHDRSHA